MVKVKMGNYLLLDKNDEINNRKQVDNKIVWHIRICWKILFLKLKKTISWIYRGYLVQIIWLWIDNIPFSRKKIIFY